jgi:acetyl esterase/lipase
VKYPHTIPVDIVTHRSVGDRRHLPHIPIPLAPRAILLVHGGAYCYRVEASWHLLVLHYSRRLHSTVFVPHYRLAPIHPFPAALDDVIATYRWLLMDVEHGGCGYRPEEVAWVGESAGAGCLVACALRCKEENVDPPSCVYLQSPWIDLTCESTPELPESWTAMNAISDMATTNEKQSALKRRNKNIDLAEEEKLDGEYLKTENFVDDDYLPSTVNDALMHGEGMGMSRMRTEHMLSNVLHVKALTDETSTVIQEMNDSADDIVNPMVDQENPTTNNSSIPTKSSRSPAHSSWQRHGPYDILHAPIWPFDLARSYVRKKSLTHPYASPWFADCADLANSLPNAVLIQVGAREYLMDEGILLAHRIHQYRDQKTASTKKEEVEKRETAVSWLRWVGWRDMAAEMTVRREMKAEVQCEVYEDMTHVFQLFWPLGYTPARIAVEQGCRFLQQHLWHAQA